MLHLFQSNRIETLAELLAEVLARPLDSPFQPETVMVQSQGMERWLELYLARRLTVCANVDFPLPASFVWQLMRSVLGELPRHSPFSPEILAWRIMGWLERAERIADFPRLQTYLAGGGDYRRYELACRIAEVFDQYLVYRPDWIARWEAGASCGLGPDEGWQAAMWRDLAQEAGGKHWAHLMGLLLRRLDGDSPKNLPERVTLFGISSLSPLFLEMVGKLALHTDVHVFALNPSQEYWELIRDWKEQARLAATQEADDLFLETGNPLLASLGKQGRDFFGALASLPELEDVFVASGDREGTSLLQCLQGDILNLADPEAADFTVHEIASGDRSLQIHSCHNPMREIEVLHDQLLRLFAADPELLPSDVAVLCPDSAAYAPYVDAVFAPSAGKPFIPYSIAGQRGAGALAATFLALLDLPASRFNADWVLGLLEQPALLRRFGLEEGDLPAIHRWVRETGIRWGRDAAHKAELGLPASPRHTWRDGLERLLLGYALPQAAAEGGLPLYGGTLPYDDIEGSQAQVAGCFAELAETLFEFAGKLKGERPLGRWVELLNILLERLFAPDSEEEILIRQIRDKLALLREVGETAGFTQPVALAVVKSWLAGQLEQDAGSGGLFGGGVSFAGMAPMRGLPFKVICLLGLNDGAFPRRQTPTGFDLIAAHPRPGDRSRRLDDRYLFLEMLLSARDVLYLSHVGQDIRDNRELPPSVLVAELLDAVGASCGAETARNLVTRHYLQPFSPGYFQGAAAYPAYSRSWLAASRELGAGATMPPLFDAPLPEPEEEWNTVEFERLAAFFSNPARYLLQQRLNIRLEEGDADFEVREPFELDYFTRLEVRSQVLDNLHAGRPREAALLLAEAQGWLPHGDYGARLLAHEEAVVEQLAARLQAQLPQRTLAPLPLTFAAHGMRLTGWLANVGEDGLAEYSIDEIKPRRLFALWLRHLALCWIKPAGIPLRSRLIGIDRSVQFGVVAQPEEELAKLLDHYRQGLRYPLPFFVKSAHAYATKIHAGKGEEEALKAAHLAWDEPDQRNGDFHGESENGYYRAVYRGHDPLDERFQQGAVELLLPMLQAVAQGEVA